MTTFEALNSRVNRPVPLGWQKTVGVLRVVCTLAVILIPLITVGPVAAETLQGAIYQSLGLAAGTASQNEATNTCALTQHGYEGAKNTSSLDHRLAALDLEGHHFGQRSDLFRSLEAGAEFSGKVSLGLWLDRQALEVASVYFEVLRVREQLRLARASLKDRLELIQPLLSPEKSKDSANGRKLAYSRVEQFKIVILEWESRMQKAISDYEALVGELPAALDIPDPASTLLSNSGSKVMDEATVTHELIGQKELSEPFIVAHSQKRNEKSTPNFKLRFGQNPGSMDIGMTQGRPEYRAMVLMSFNIDNLPVNEIKREYPTGWDIRSNFATGRVETRTYPELSMSETSKIGEPIKSLVGPVDTTGEAAEWIALNDAQKALARQGVRLDKITEQRALLRERYESSGIGLMELIDSDDQVYQERTALTDVRYTLQLAEYQVLASMGKLAAFLGITFNRNNDLMSTLPITVQPDVHNNEKSFNKFMKAKNNGKDRCPDFEGAIKYQASHDINGPSGKLIDVNSEVLEVISQWMRAWSGRETDSYLAFYATEFLPESGEDKKTWEVLRKNRIEEKRFIQLSIDKATVKVNGPNNATISFRQRYSSDKASDICNKILDMKRTPSGWRIVREIARAAY